MILEIFRKPYEGEAEIDLKDLDSAKPYSRLQESMNIPGSNVVIQIAKLNLEISNSRISADHLNGEKPELINLRRCHTRTGSYLTGVITNNNLYVRVII